jgi:hypothetical protein
MTDDMLAIMGMCQLWGCCLLRSRHTTIRKVTYNNVVHFLFLVAEIRPATIALDDGETVGHRILDLDLSRQLAGTGGAGHAPHLRRCRARAPSLLRSAFQRPPVSPSSPPTLLCLTASCLFFTTVTKVACALDSTNLKMSAD